MSGTEMWRKTLTGKPKLSREDLKLALDAASLRDISSVTPSKLDAALGVLNDSLDHLICVVEGGTAKDINSIASRFQDMSRSCEAIISAVGADRFAGGREVGVAELSTWLSKSLEPLILGLVDGASATGKHEKPEQVVASILLGVDLLGTWSREAAVRYARGAEHERHRKKTALAKTPAREFGFSLIAAYHDLTNAQLAFSRHSAGPNDNRPTGPLIRFLRAMFAQTRSLLAERPDLRKMVDALDLHPSDEALASWIRAVKALQKASKAPTW